MKLIPVIFFCVACLTANAQKDSLAFYFDDGGLSNTKNILKIDATGWIGGDYSFHYERVISRQFTFEIGGGYWTGGNLLQHPYNISIIPNTNRTFSYKLRAKLYYPDWRYGGAPRNLYNALMFRYRTADFPETSKYSKANFYDLILQSGYQYFIIKRLTLDIHAGFGVSFKNLNYEGVPNKIDDGENHALVFNLGLKIGYRL